VKKIVSQKVNIFREKAANVRQRKLWVLKISILPQNSPKWSFSPKFFYFWSKHAIVPAVLPQRPRLKNFNNF